LEPDRHFGVRWVDGAGTPTASHEAHEAPDAPDVQAPSVIGGFCFLASVVKCRR
jgi:hypothetical protein